MFRQRDLLRYIDVMPLTCTKVQSWLAYHEFNVSFANYTNDGSCKLEILFELSLWNPSLKVEVCEFCLFNRYKAIDMLIKLNWVIVFSPNIFHSICTISFHWFHSDEETAWIAFNDILTKNILRIAHILESKERKLILELFISKIFYF